MLCVDKKRHIKGEKYITPMNFAEHLRLENQTFQRIAMFILIDSYKMDFKKILLYWYNY